MSLTGTVSTAIPKFDGTNYSTWEETISSLLMIQKAWGHVTGTVTRPATGDEPQATWDEVDWMAVGIMKAHMTLSVQREHGNKMVGTTATKRNAKELWDALKSAYGTTAAIDGFLYWKQLTSFKFVAGETLEKQLEKMDDLRSMATSADITISDSHYCLMLLAALPASENWVTSYLANNKPSTLTPTTVKQTILSSVKFATAQGKAPLTPSPRSLVFRF
jgi:hypothetical protein